MKRLFLAASALTALAAPGAATAADAGPFTISGSAALVSDYRLRGVSQSDNHAAVQGGITVAHQSGLYAGFWSSSLAGWGSFGGANMELDLIGGYRRALSDAATLDVGLTWYLYPGGADRSDYAEPYVKLGGTRGPLTLTGSVAYAPPQQALGRWYRTGAEAAAGVYSHPGDKKDNLYLAADGALALPNLPITAKAHIGHSHGNDGLGPNATSAAPTGDYWDWSLGGEAHWKQLTLGLAWIDTDISRRDSAYLQPAFSQGQDGRGSIAGSRVVGTLTAGF
ncbi:TorF family putative porin [Sphingomonas morindae]|uniref:TorF family putative porin n=1 Tax=Sphingomonas morindae TaxID=1541170 RepID=A0ABY4XDM6_9SPHN|nr:TorF family putative porin [Sphingomonas morindae]USI74795.1 TorF family putative porin [Sphingomonas morindae]